MKDKDAQLFSRHPASSLCEQGMRFGGYHKPFIGRPSPAPKIHRQLADTTIMSIDSVATLSTAMSQAQLQSAASIKIFKMIQGQDQIAADLLDAALENVQASMQQYTEDLGTNVDTLA